MVESLYGMAQGGSQGGQTNPLTTIIFIVMIIGILYFLLFMPQRRQEQKRRQMIDSLKKGDDVVTSGGIHGTISRVKEDTLVIKIAEKLEITVEKNSVSRLSEKK
jgi:preprotein translocase subunit YajC